MRTTLSILLIVFFATASAQKIRFTDPRNHWVTTGQRGMPTIYFGNHFSYGSDSVMFSNTYKPIIESGGGPTLSYRYWIREDTIANKVFYREPNKDTLEHILYDYNLHISDSISYSNNTVDTVQSIDSILIGGIFHKVFTMRGKYYWRVYTFIEGVGGTNNPFWPSFFNSSFIEYTEGLLCFSQDSLMQAITSSWFVPWLPLDSFRNGRNNCNIIIVFVNNTEKQKPSISISPNPAYDYIDVAPSGQFTNNTFVSVYDMTGKCIYHTQADEMKSTIKINASSFPDGLYMVIVQNNTGILKREKIIIRK